MFILLQAEVETVREECERKIMALREEEKEGRVELCLHTTCTLFVHCLHTICALLAHYLCTTCTLFVHCLHTICALVVHHLYTACIPLPFPPRGGWGTEGEQAIARSDWENEVSS